MSSTWHQDFLDNGFAVIPGVISKAKAAEYQQAAFAWLKSFDNPALDLSDPESWTQTNLPFVSSINTFNHYGVVHEKFMWDIRQEQSIIDVFGQLWQTDELLVSFDALNITLPRRPDHNQREPWPHVDQSPFRTGRQCIQGIVSLSESGPDDGGLTVYSGTHNAIHEFFENHTDKAQWETKDFYKFSTEQISWFEDRGFQAQKVVASPGDLIIWDSRLIHWGAEPNAASNTIRTATYVSYAPAALASKAVLEKKKEACDKWSATTHWPHENIVIRSNEPILPDGTVDKRRNAPRQKPELTGRLLRLAGVQAY
jgi:hypothetical protein